MNLPTLSNKTVKATDIGNRGNAMRNYNYEEISVDREKQPTINIIKLKP